MVSKRHTLWENSDLKMDLEYANGEWYIHCDIYEWSLAVYRDILLAITDSSPELTALGIKRLLAQVPDDDNKLRKFVEMFGFEKTNARTLTETDSIYVLEVDKWAHSQDL